MTIRSRCAYSHVGVRGLVLLASLALAPAVMADRMQAQKITSIPRGVNAQFGYAIAISGNTMVVGAPFDSTTAASAGAAFVYVLNGTTWTQQARLLVSDGARLDNFGQSVAISGDTIVVGAPRADAPLSNNGAAYVFVRSGTTWTQQQKLTASDGTADDEFGNSVAIAGETLAVGAHFADLSSARTAGSVYLFRRTGTTWTQTLKLVPTRNVPSHPVLGPNFGESVAMSGNRLVVGSPGEVGPNVQGAREGAVYVFVEVSGGTYTLQQKLLIPDGASNDSFGSSVAIEGNTLVGGAPNYSRVVGHPYYGAAYVFEFGGATWTQQGRLTASDGAEFTNFGWSVAVSNNVVAVGAYGDDTAAGADAGSAYLFTRSGTTWTQIQKLAPPDPFLGDRFGASVALSAGRLVVGASEKWFGSAEGRPGAAYYFVLPPSAPTALMVTASGSSVALAWTAPASGSAPDTYVIEAGSAPGLSDLANFSTGTALTSFAASGVAAGTYYVRVRAGNASGTSAPSNEAVLTVGGTGDSRHARPN